MAQRVNKKRYDNSAYVGGSTVRKLYVAQPVPSAEPRRREADEERRAKREHQRQLHRANRLNFLYTAAVSGIVGVIFFICYQYLNLQSTVKANASRVAQLQSQLNQMISENDEEEIQINTSIDYDKIYETAVNELGMVYPERNQVITYDAGESEYVKQYQDIPAAK